MTRRRVVITGLGTVNPLGLNVPDYWRGLLAGQSGIAPITHFDTSAFQVKFGGEVKGFNPEPVIDTRMHRRFDRFTQFAVYAAAEAVKDSGLDFAKEDPFRCGCIFGSGIGGLNELEDGAKILADRGPGRLGPFLIAKMIANAARKNTDTRLTSVMVPAPRPMRHPACIRGRAAFGSLGGHAIRACDATL